MNLNKCLSKIVIVVDMFINMLKIYMFIDIFKINMVIYDYKYAYYLVIKFFVLCIVKSHNKFTTDITQKIDKHIQICCHVDCILI